MTSPGPDNTTYPAEETTLDRSPAAISQGSSNQPLVTAGTNKPRIGLIVFLSLGVLAQILLFSISILGMTVAGMLYNWVPLRQYLYVSNILGGLSLFILLIVCMCPLAFSAQRSYTIIYTISATLMCIGIIFSSTWMSTELRDHGTDWSGTNYEKLRVENTFLCCGYRSTIDYPVLPCPVPSSGPCEPKLANLATNLDSSIWFVGCTAVFLYIVAIVAGFFMASKKAEIQGDAQIN